MGDPSPLELLLDQLDEVKAEVKELRQEAARLALAVARMELPVLGLAPRQWVVVMVSLAIIAASAAAIWTGDADAATAAVKAGKELINP